MWKTLQDRGYFESHPCYQGISEFGGAESVAALEWLGPLRPDMQLAVIGCGFGRETLKIAPLVGHVWGIDVTPGILQKAVKFLSEKGVHNFTPVLAERFEAEIPDKLDAFFSIIVMQHLTRDLVRHYFVELARKLKDGGGCVVQFLQESVWRDDRMDHDAPTDQAIEPSVSWTAWQLVHLARQAKLEVHEIRTVLATPDALWHWAIFRKPAAHPGP